MRSILILLIAVSCLTAADPFEGFVFTDGQTRTAADFAGQHVALVYLCAH